MSGSWHSSITRSSRDACGKHGMQRDFLETLQVRLSDCEKVRAVLTWPCREQKAVTVTTCNLLHLLKVDVADLRTLVRYSAQPTPNRRLFDPTRQALRQVAAHLNLASCHMESEAPILNASECSNRILFVRVPAL